MLTVALGNAFYGNHLSIKLSNSRGPGQINRGAASQRHTGWSRQRVQRVQRVQRDRAIAPYCLI